MLAVNHLVGFGVQTPSLPTDTDPLFASVVLLIQPPTGAATIADRTGRQVSVTNATLDADAPFPGIRSVRFDGASWLSVPNDGAFDFPGDFTIEMWAKLDSRSIEGGAGRRLFEAGSYTAALSDGTGQIWMWNGTESAFSPGAADGGVWRHVVLERAGGFRGAAVGGVFGTLVSSSGTFACTLASLLIGTHGPTTGRLLGRLTGVRFTRGIARYGLAPFTPPTVPFAAA